MPPNWSVPGSIQFQNLAQCTFERFELFFRQIFDVVREAFLGSLLDNLAGANQQLFTIGKLRGNGLSYIA